MNIGANSGGNGTLSGTKVVNCVCGAGHLKEVVVVKERSVVLQLSLMGLLYLILPLLFQFCDALKATQEIIRQSETHTSASVQVNSQISLFLNSTQIFWSASTLF